MKPVVNNFNIAVATVNGSGSISANMALVRSFLNMGVPAYGKNFFPSNISGMPTLFTMRVSEQGWAARARDAQICVAMCEATYEQDIADLKPGSMVIYNDAFPLRQQRGDLFMYPLPVNPLAGKVTAEPKLKKLLANMVYLGALQELLGLEQEAVEKAISTQFAGKAKAVALNVQALNQGRDHVREHVQKIDPYRVERRDIAVDKILIDGNSACAMGAMFAGCTVLAWYPITPASTVSETFISMAGKYRHEADGKATYAIVQAEDELSSLGMVVGAGWTGARAMTSTSGPGISLMSEITGLAYFTETPGVIFDVQRSGPSTGSPTRTQQSDLMMLAFLSHGDTQHIALIPHTVSECFEMSIQAFELAERFQTIVFVVTDLDLGMNYWASDAFTYPEKPIDRGKVLSAEDLDRIGSFARYKDVDGDGIPYRTLPGNPHPKAPWVARGSGHDERAIRTENPQAYADMLDRLTKKFETARQEVPAPIVRNGPGGGIGIIGYGTSHYAIEEARALLSQKGIETSYLRLRALPISREVDKFLAAHEHTYVVEQNQSGQLEQLLRIHNPGLATRCRGVRHYTTMPMDAETVVEKILAFEKEASK